MASFLEWFPARGGLVLSPLVKTFPWVNLQVALHVLMNENFAYNIDQCRAIWTSPHLKCTLCVHSLTYLWDRFGQKSKWVSWKNVWRESPPRSPCCWRHWLSHSAPLTLSELMLENCQFRHRKQSSSCRQPAHHLSLSALSSLHPQQTWMNCTQDQWWGWASFPQHLSCLGSDGCWPWLE